MKTIERCLDQHLHMDIDNDGFDASWIHVVARSKRHAERLIALLGWYPCDYGPGQFFRQTWFDDSRKRLYTRFGYDI